MSVDASLSEVHLGCLRTPAYRAKCLILIPTNCGKKLAFCLCQIPTILAQIGRNPDKNRASGRTAGAWSSWSKPESVKSSRWLQIFSDKILQPFFHHMRLSAHFSSVPGCDGWRRCGRNETTYLDLCFGKHQSVIPEPIYLFPRNSTRAKLK